MAPFAYNSGPMESAKVDVEKSTQTRRYFNVIGYRRKEGIGAKISMGDDGTMVITLPRRVMSCNRINFPTVSDVDPARHDDVICRILNKPVSQVLDAYEKLQQMGNQLVQNQNSPEFTSSVDALKANSLRGRDIMVRDVLAKSADSSDTEIPPSWFESKARTAVQALDLMQEQAQAYLSEFAWLDHNGRLSVIPPPDGDGFTHTEQIFHLWSTFSAMKQGYQCELIY